MNKSYNELIHLLTFDERLQYLQEAQKIGEQTFGPHRRVNQVLYNSPEWKLTRHKVIVRDNGLDLATPGYTIMGGVYIHHINAITEEDILERRPCVFDLNNLICCSFTTHNLIHFGLEQPNKEYIPRTPNDTAPWRETNYAG